MDQNAVVLLDEEKTLTYWVEENGNKRSYIYDYAKARACSHPHLIEMVQGMNWYRCEQCNFCHFIMTAYTQPLHNVVLAGLQTALYFSKEHGVAALQQVARQETGQYDGREHKPVIPEGLTFGETLGVLEAIDVTTPDHGEQQLRSVQNAVWNGRGYLRDGRARCLNSRKRHHYGINKHCSWCGEGQVRRLEEVNGNHGEITAISGGVS
jgi:hypothetical protein